MPKIREKVSPIERPNPVPTNAIKTMNRMLRRTCGLIYKKISQLEEKINIVNSETESVAVQPMISPNQDNSKLCYVNVAQSINVEKPKFPGKNIHPVTFIEDLTSWLKKTPIKDNEIELIIECLEGEARDWARIYTDRWSGLEDFKRDFFATYWGEAEQNELRRKIVCNTWNKEKKPTMLGHFIALTAQAKMLSYPIPEKQLIEDIMRHFPKEVQYAWANQSTTSILDASEFLRKLDNINKQESFIKPSSENPQKISRDQGSTGNKGYQGSSNYNRQANFNLRRSGNPTARRMDRGDKTTEINLIENTEELNNVNNVNNDIHVQNLN